MTTGGPGGKKNNKENKLKFKTSLQFKYKENGVIHYWVNAFPRSLIAEGFAATVLHNFSCVVSELHPDEKLDSLKCFTLIVPENKHEDFINWLKKTLNLKFKIKK